eukprot:68088_1
MQASRRRRTTTRLNSDNYDPKKKNHGKRNVYIAIGAIVFVIGLIVVYKLLSTSSPSTVSNTNNSENVYEEGSDYGAADLDTNDEEFDKANIPNIHMDAMSQKMKSKVFGRRPDKFAHPLKGGLFGRPDRKRKPRHHMDRFEEDGVFDEAKKKLEAAKKAPPFNDVGEGPIFNGLDEGRGGKLTPQQVHAAKNKLRKDMRGMGGPFGGLPGMRNPMRQRGHEM